MQYTVWHRGSNLGHTDLGFRQHTQEARVGWFHPTEAGERVMPLVSAVPAAMRALTRAHCVLDDGLAPAPSSEECATLFADLAEAFQHLQALELELRREDGSPVAVTDIGIQDTFELCQLARPDIFEPMDEVDWECDDGDFDTAAFDPDDPEGLGDLRELEDVDDLDDLLFGPPRPDGADEPPASIGRYQIIVRLVDAEALP